MSKGWRTPESWKGWDSPVHGKRRGKSRVDFVKVLIIAGVVIIALLFLNSYYEASKIGLGSTTTSTTFSTTTTTTAPYSKGTAGLLVAIKGSDPKIPGGTAIQAMGITITSVDLRGLDGQWTNVYDGTLPLDLSNYLDKAALIAQVETKDGTFDAVRIRMANGTVDVTNSFLSMNTPRRLPLDLPYETVIANNATTKAGDVLTIVLNLDIGSSLSRYGAGYTMTPKFAVSDQTGVPAGIAMI